MSPLPRSQTPAEMAASMIASPEMDFAANPWNAVGDATTKAVEHYEAGRLDDSRYWVAVALDLVTAADNPKVGVGASLGGLAAEFGITLG